MVWCTQTYLSTTLKFIKIKKKLTCCDWSQKGLYLSHLSQKLWHLLTCLALFFLNSCFLRILDLWIVSPELMMIQSMRDGVIGDQKVRFQNLGTLRFLVGVLGVVFLQSTQFSPWGRVSFVTFRPDSEEDLMWCPTQPIHAAAAFWQQVRICSMQTSGQTSC